MKRYLFFFVGMMISSFIVTGTVSAAPVQWSGNGHWYEMILDSKLWSDAKADSEKHSYNGMTGHLVTITSSEENQFIVDQFANHGLVSAWIGAYQESGTPEPDGDWQWVTGETWSYTNWAAGEPNDAGGEDQAEIYLWGEYTGTWNDEKPTVTQGYLIEYEPVPIPGAVWLLGSGLIGLVAFGGRRMKR